MDNIKKGLPMQKKSTTVKFEISNTTHAHPKLSTVNLLIQFARVYTYNEALQPGLRNFIPN